MKRIKKSNFWMGDRYLCPHCHTAIGYLDKFCGHCGVAVEWERCPYCGYSTENMKGDFCKNCGTVPIRR